jgi:hypothetical protein
MGDLLKEAIADAKAVRETALANAKMALEEAFTPQLKSMLSAKLREDDDDYEDEESAEDEIGDEEESAEEEIGDEEESAEEEAFDEDEDFGDDFGDEDGDEESFDDEEEVAETIEVNGKTYSLVSEDDGEESEDEMDYGDDDEDEDLDLESIIKELENELSEEDESEDGSEEDDDEFDVDESIFEEEEDFDFEDDDEEEVEESFDLIDEDDEDSEKMEDIKSELAQYKEAVEFMKDKLHEVNILNAKLLFTNKLFKQYSLDNNQKLKVVETFDRAHTTREIKLVYSTLAGQFGDSESITRKYSIKESASSVIGSTRSSKQSRKVITDEETTANRFRELAGIMKK